LNPSILLKIYEIAGRVLKNQESFWKKKKKRESLPLQKNK
jgi:hypothetical protein